MKYCKKCYLGNPDDANFCIECGDTFGNVGITQRFNIPNKIALSGAFQRFNAEYYPVMASGAYYPIRVMVEDLTSS